MKWIKIDPENLQQLPLNIPVLVRSNTSDPVMRYSAGVFKTRFYILEKRTVLKVDPLLTVLVDITMLEYVIIGEPKS